MKKLAWILLFSLFFASCNNSSISESINIWDWSGNNINISNDWIKTTSDSWETNTSISWDTNWMNLQSNSKDDKSSLNISKEWIKATWWKDWKTWVSISSSWWVQVDWVEWAGTKEVDELLNSIDKMIDDK